MENENLQRLGFLFAADYYGRHIPEAEWRRAEIENLASHIARSIRMTFDMVQENIRVNSTQALAALTPQDRQPYDLLITAMFESMDNVDLTDPTLVQAVDRFQEVLKGME
jgi:hypothetical protein